MDHFLNREITIIFSLDAVERLSEASARDPAKCALKLSNLVLMKQQVQCSQFYNYRPLYGTQMQAQSENLVTQTTWNRNH